MNIRKTRRSGKSPAHFCLFWLFRCKKEPRCCYDKNIRKTRKHRNKTPSVYSVYSDVKKKKKHTMLFSTAILDELTAQAKASPRLRMNLDLRNTPADQSQRMLNALEPGTVMPIHRHRNTSETVVVLRGKDRKSVV